MHKLVKYDISLLIFNLIIKKWVCNTACVHTFVFLSLVLDNLSHIQPILYHKMWEISRSDRDRERVLWFLWSYQDTDSVIHTESACCPKSRPSSEQTAGSGQAFKPVRGGVRRGDNQIIHLLSGAGRPMKRFSKGYFIMTTIHTTGEGRAPEYFWLLKGMRSRSGSESTAAPQHDPASNSWCALVEIGETDTPVMNVL